MISSPAPRADQVTIRTATLDDAPALAALIASSARVLGAADYTVEQIEGALRGAWGVDTELITARTYYVGAVADAIVLCGGWSRRATAFGGDAREGRESRLLDPTAEAARIRAFFVHPAWARLGLASRLLRRCEEEARRVGFAATELVATLPGRQFYARHGYVAGNPFTHRLDGDVSIVFVPMGRRL